MQSTFQRQGPRILKGTSSTISIQPTADGVAVTPTSGTVTVTDEAGTTLVNGQAITVSGTKATYALTPTHTDQVAQLTATWTLTIGAVQESFVTHHQVVGALLFTLAEARAWDNGTLSNTTTYPDATLLEGRDTVAEAFEDICGVAFGTAYGREILSGGECFELWLDQVRCQSIRSMAYRLFGSTSWTSLTQAELDDLQLAPNGKITREALAWWPDGNRNVRVEYEYGWQSIPLEIKRAALRLVREVCVKSPLDDRATSQTFDGATFSLATAGRAGAWFGIPTVDATLERYAENGKHRGRVA